MVNSILIYDSILDIKIIQIRDGKIINFFLEKKEKNKVGDIFLGKVENIIKDIDAAFVELEFSSKGFLKGVTNKSIHKNKDILVQITKEEVRNKKYTVSDVIQLKGKYMVLTFGEDYIGISKKITCDNERDRLRSIVSKNLPDNTGAIIRTISKDVSENLLIKDIQVLIENYNEIINKQNTVYSPKKLFSNNSFVENTLKKLQIKKEDEIIVNTKRIYDNLYSNLDCEKIRIDKSKLTLIEDRPILKENNLIKEINDLLKKRIWLKNGSYIIIEKLEAFTIIDVNSGKNNKLKGPFTINKIALEEIVNQIILRNLSGIILIDFIDMKTNKEKNELVDYCKQLFKRDKKSHRILGLSNLDIMEITRKKEEIDLGEYYTKECNLCSSRNMWNYKYLIFLIEEEIISHKIHRKSNDIFISLVENYYYYLLEVGEFYIKKLEKKYVVNIILEKSSDLKSIIKFR